MTATPDDGPGPPAATDGPDVHAAAADGPTPWYSDGLRFTCTQCGNCCTGPPGVVWFTPEEGSAMAATLDLDDETFRRRHARKIGRRWSLTERRTPHGMDCVFLDRESRPGKALCRVYLARPLQCRTWPFWPENLDTPESWSEAKGVARCPGMDTGRHHSLQQIRIEMDRHTTD